MTLAFANSQIEGKFFRVLRLVHDDLCSYASAAAPYCAIHSQQNDTDLIVRLNQNRTFWNSVRASLQTTAIVSLGRLHDKAKNHNHLTSLLKELDKQDAACVAAALELRNQITLQHPFIDKILKLRHGLFAHTSLNAPLIASFGFEEIKLTDFREYWNALMGAMEKCDSAMFGQQMHFPKFETSLFESIENCTLKALAVKPLGVAAEKRPQSPLSRR